MAAKNSALKNKDGEILHLLNYIVSDMVKLYGGQGCGRCRIQDDASIRAEDEAHVLNVHGIKII